MTTYLRATDVSLGKNSALRRLYIGAGLLVVGAGLLGLGGIVLGTKALTVAGLSPALALKVAVSAVALLVPGLFGGLLLQVPAGVRFQASGAGGVSLTAGGVAVLWVTVPPSGLAGPLEPLLPPAILYGTGLIAAVLSPVLAGTAAVVRGPEPVPELADADWNGWDGP